MEKKKKRKRRRREEKKRGRAKGMDFYDFWYGTMTMSMDLWIFVWNLTFSMEYLDFLCMDICFGLWVVRNLTLE